MKKLFLILMFAALATVSAQQKYVVGTISSSLTLAHFNSFIPNVSPLGLNAEYRKFIDRDISIGFAGGINYFSSSSTSDYNFDGTVVTGDNDRSAVVIPILLQTHYFFGYRNKPSFNFGFGFGAIYAYKSITYSGKTLTQKRFHVAIVPDAAFTYPINDNLQFIAQLKFNYAMATIKKSSSNAFDVDDYGFLSLNLGVMWKL
jgi:long-subunit fatty acid transport protein